MTGPVGLAGSARLVLVEGAALLHPEPAVFEAILAGWRQQQQSRLLAAPTVDSRDKTLRRFQTFTGEYPWRWGPVDIEQWSVSLRSAGRSGSTIRAYQNAVAMFCDFACDGRYGWVLECEQRFGEHPSQICHDWNTADHVADYEGDPARRPFSREELQGFFDYADERVAAARAHGRKGGLAAWRDTAMFKVTYAWGLRRREAAMLDTTDFSTNPSAPELGRFGMLSVRFGKGDAGQPAPSAQRRDCDALGGRGAAGVPERGAPLLWVLEPRAVADRARRADQHAPHQREIQCLSRGDGPSERADPALSAALLYQSSRRGRRGPALCPAAGRPLLGVHDRYLHLGVH